MNQNKEQNEKRYNYFYKITNLINGKFYYGIRSTNNNPEEDKYMGSGNAIKQAIKKHGRENFVKEIIANYSTREEVLLHETNAVTKELIELNDCYNLRTGGYSNLTISESTRKLMSLWKRRPMSDDEKNHLREINLGKKYSDETKQKHRASRLGYKHTEETIDKMRKSQQLYFESIGEFCLTEQRKQAISKSMKGNTHKTGKGKKCSVDGVVYNTIKDVMNKFNLGWEAVTKRFKSTKEKWKTWEYINTKLPHKRRCIINGQIFDSLSDAGKHYDIKRNQVFSRIRSNRSLYQEWKYYDED